MTTSNLQSLALALWGFAGVAGLVFVFQMVYWRTTADELRQRLFMIRRDLFLFMADGNVQPTAPAYVHLRTTANSLIYFGDRLSFLRLLVDAIVLRRQGKRYAKCFDQMLANVEDEKVRQALRRFNDRLMTQMVRHLVVTSPTLWVVIAAIVAVVLPVHAIRYTRNGLRSAVSEELRNLHDAILAASLRNPAPFNRVQAEARYLAKAA